MLSIMKREVKNYMKNPLLWTGIAIGVLMVFQNVSPYLNIHYLREGETIVNDYPQNCRDGDVFDGYVPTEKELRREMWEEQIQEVLTSEFETENAYYEYENIACHKGTREEINSYISEKMENRTFSYYFSRKFADFAGLFMGFFATVLLSVLFMQDTKRSICELLHTKPVSAGKYLSGKVSGGFSICLITCAALNLIFFCICLVSTRSSGFEVRLTDFLLASCFYILPNMLMIVSVYSLVSLLLKNPLPAVPLLFLYIVYSNMGSRNAKGIYGYYGRPLAIMVRFPGGFFDTAPPPMALLNQSFHILVAICIIFVSIQIWKRRRVY